MQNKHAAVHSNDEHQLCVLTFRQDAFYSPLFNLTTFRLENSGAHLVITVQLTHVKNTMVSSLQSYQRKAVPPSTRISVNL